MRTGSRQVRRVTAAILLLAAGPSVTAAAPGRYVEAEDFIAQALPAVPERPEVLFVDAVLRARIESVLGHRLPLLRMRYWQHGETTVWIMDEVGKTEPITIGVAVENGRVRSVRVLEFRESRGYEVRHPFFTDQFAGAGIDGDSRLDRSVDGITGATLSVAAVDKVVRVALICDAEVRGAHQLAGR